MTVSGHLQMKVQDQSMQCYLNRSLRPLLSQASPKFSTHRSTLVCAYLQVDTHTCSNKVNYIPLMPSCNTTSLPNSVTSFFNPMSSYGLYILLFETTNSFPSHLELKRSDTLCVCFLCFMCVVFLETGLGFTNINFSSG